MPEIKHKAVTDRYRRREVKPETNKYYLTVSNRYMRAKFVAIALLIVFFGFMLFRFSDDISYSNLMYLLRDFDTDPKTAVSGFEHIEYDEQNNMNFSIYKGELSVIGNRTLKMYNVRGAETRSYEPGYSDPVLVSSDKYLLAYNVGTPSYSVYTSIARVNSDNAPGNIESADMNDNGQYLLVCRSKDTKYVVCTYDSAFRPLAEYYKTRYVTSSSIGENGQVVIASFDSDGAAYNCEIELYFDGSQEADSVYTTAGVFPIKCGIWDNGNYYVICTDRILFFDSKGNLIKTSESTFEYTSFAETENGLAVSFDNDSIGGSSSIFVFDTAGEMLYNKTIDGSISSLSISDETIYALVSSKAYMISINNGEVLDTDVEEGGAVLLSYGGSCVICYRHGAEGLLFGDTLTETSTVTDTVSESTNSN